MKVPINNAREERDDHLREAVVAISLGGLLEVTDEVTLKMNT